MTVLKNTINTILSYKYAYIASLLLISEKKICQDRRGKVVFKRVTFLIQNVEWTAMNA